MKAAIKYVLAAVFSCGLISCTQPGKERVDDRYNAIFTSVQLAEKWEHSFEQMKRDSFEQIFAHWNSAIPSNTEEFINQNDTVRAVFDVYRAFYKPLNLLTLGDFEWVNDLNSKCMYTIVQNEIFYSVSSADGIDFDSETVKKDSIENFRPPVDLEKSKVLYLTSEYDESIRKFLGTQSSKPGEENIMNPAHTEGESERRYEALQQYIPIIHGHWGGYWHLETHPHVSMIVFNRTMTKAKIYFRVGYEGGEAKLEKNGSLWFLRESKSTWIE